MGFSLAGCLEGTTGALFGFDGFAPASQLLNYIGTMASYRLPSTINTKEDPEKLFQLVEKIGTGSYGEVFKVRRLRGRASLCRFSWTPWRRHVSSARDQYAPSRSSNWSRERTWTKFSMRSTF